MRYKYSPNRCLVACLGSALLGSGALAGTFTTDFNSDVPLGMTLHGVAKIEPDATGNTNTTGVLKLTEATVGSSSGGAILDELDPGQTVTAFEANFLVHIGRGNGADGMSFFFGDFADGAHSEEGPGTINGLTVVFDVYNNATGGGVPEAPSIDVKWNNIILGHRLVGTANATTAASPIGSLNTVRTQTGATTTPAVYVPVKITVDANGRFSLSYNNVAVYSNLPIFRPITDFSIGGLGARFGFAARTGGSHDDHWVENLSITTQTAPDAGQPYATKISPYGLANQGAGAPASAVGGVAIELRDSTYSVDTNTIVLRYNNNVVTPNVSRGKSSPEAPEDDLTIITYFGADGVALPSGQGTVQLNYSTTSPTPLPNQFSYTFPIAPVSTLPSAWRVSGVDTSKPGFKGRVHQMDTLRAPGDQNITQNGERHVNLGYKDPTTGLPYENVAAIDPSTLDANGFFDIPGTINFEQAGGNAGLITGSTNPARQEELFPGIPGLSGSTDNFANEFLGFIELPAGGHRFGVYADDRIRFSFGPAHHAVGTPALAASTGANQESVIDVIVSEAGVYPFRLSHWEGGGGAHVELFYVDKATGQRTLLNDPEDLSIPKVYREASGSRPSIARALPVENWVGAFPDEDVIIDIRDGAIPVIDGTIAMLINNVDQQISKSKSGNVTTVRRAGSVDNLLPSGLSTVSIVFGWMENGSQVLSTNSYSFTVAPYLKAIPLANRVPSEQINTAETGFSVRYNQIDRSRNNNQGEGGRIAGAGDANRMPFPEVQLNSGFINPTNGNAYPNVAAVGPNSNWTDVLNVFNFNMGNVGGVGAPVNSGFFTATAPPVPLLGQWPEESAPGLPGDGTSNLGLDNYVLEATAYLELKKGVHVFGMNSDDGYVISSAPNPKDTLGTMLGFFNGGRGNAGSLNVTPVGQNPPQPLPGVSSGSTPFSVIVPEDGIYPFRVLYWQGGGGVNAELFTVNKDNGTVVLVNDTVSGAPHAVPAYRTYTGTEKPYTAFSVSPTPWDNVVAQNGPGPITLLGRTRNSATSVDIHALSGTNRPFADQTVGGIVVNGASDANVKLLLDGAEVAATRTVNGTDVTLSYKPEAPFASGSRHTAALVYAGTTNEWSFTIQAYATLNTADAVDASKADATARGFSTKIVQAATGQANTAARAEAQLAGDPASIAVPSSEPDGRYITTGIINWSNNRNSGFSGPEVGNFQDNTYGTGWPWPDYADEPVPGIPGTGGLTGDNARANTTAEIFAYLHFPTAGYYKLGATADDGIAVKIGTPGVTDGTVLFTHDRAGGAADIPFSFVVPQAGLYPVRLLWYNGGGGGNVEFYSYNENNNKIAINDPNVPTAIKAYYRITDVDGQPEITVTRASNGDLNITWTNGGSLEASAALGAEGNWTQVSSSGSHTVQANTPQMFFRVRK